MRNLIDILVMFISGAVAYVLSSFSTVLVLRRLVDDPVMVHPVFGPLSDLAIAIVNGYYLLVFVVSWGIYFWVIRTFLRRLFGL